MARSTPSEDKMIRVYDHLAPFYDVLHRRWLRFAGGEAQAALEAAVRMAMTPHSQLLDVGCGTGHFARTLLSEGTSPRQITLLDPSEAMLAHCRDIPVCQRRNRLEAMPFADETFDVVTCAWALETVPHPERALHELIRVLRPDGALCLTFCAGVPARRPTEWLVQKSMTLRGTGRFLDPAQVISVLRNTAFCDVRVVPCAGLAATLIARRSLSSHDTPGPQATTLDSNGSGAYPALRHQTPAARRHFVTVKLWPDH
ncbi:class I SAM-dependent methyltransferase [uncultured Roseobacter sp.]|uniref:class I SAM-dependent methyltransferase n=1 Tax=uncultured Roseobacter sp. TaxID=114847 RepID=UPI00261217D9|nr:methyltransferase domain-containing protein [uncultured Roseobacter sp.]